MINTLVPSAAENDLSPLFISFAGVCQEETLINLKKMTLMTGFVFQVHIFSFFTLYYQKY